MLSPRAGLVLAAVVVLFSGDLYSLFSPEPTAPAADVRDCYCPPASISPAITPLDLTVPIFFSDGFRIARLPRLPCITVPAVQLSSSLSVPDFPINRFLFPAFY
jgi:hypothetical protein